MCDDSKKCLPITNFCRPFKRCAADQLALQMNSNKETTKLDWPKAALSEQQYEVFLKKMDCCKQQLHKMYFRCENVNVALLKKLLDDLDEIIIKLSHSPEHYRALRSNLQMESADQRGNADDYELTYRLCYNRWRELEKFRCLLSKKMTQHRHEQIREQATYVSSTGRSTYYETICVPAIETVEKNKFSRLGPLDRHSNRRN